MNTLATILLIFSTFIISAQSETSTSTEGTTITVTVPVKNNEGSILAALYNEAQFMKEGVQNQLGTIEDGKSVMTFTNVAPGSYAVILFHDKNNNKQMDFDTNGMPLEPYGVSNNAMSYGPPQWNEAKFEVSDKPLELEIRM